MFLVALSGCSVRKMAVNQVVGVLAGGGSTFTSDDDPELVRDALPFALKTFEALLAQVPENTDLLLSTCQGFSLYTYAFVDLEAERLEPTSFRAARKLRDRALKLYLRGRDYCFQGMDLKYPGLREALIRNPERSLAEIRKEDVGLIFWTATSWGAVIAAGLDRPELVVDLPAVRALLERCLALDADYERGMIHDAMITLEGQPETLGGSIERARWHYERALELNGGQKASTYLSWAATVSLRLQDRAEFEELLGKALAIDPAQVPEAERLALIIQQERAQLMLDRIDEYFLEELEDLEDLEEVDGSEE